VTIMKGLANYERNYHLGERSWGYPVALGQITGLTRHHVCGYDAAAAAATDIWDGSAAFPNNAANAAMEIVSGSADDAAAGTGARTITVYGVALSGTSWVYQQETVALNGTTVVALTKEYLYVYKAEVTTAGTGLTNAGAITVRLASAGATQCVITATFGKSYSAVFPIASSYKGIIDLIYTDLVYVATAIGGNFALCTREGTGPWIYETVVSGASGRRIEYRPPRPIVVPEKSLIKMRTYALTAAGVVGAGFDLLLCDASTSL